MGVCMDKTAMAIETYNHIIDEYIKYLKEVNLDGGVPLQRETDYLISILPSKSKILDVGTAMGYYPKYLTEKSDKNFEVTGIDASDKMIEQAKKTALNADFKVMDIRDMKYPSKSFDCIMCFGTLIHLNDDDCLKVLNDFDRILCDNGILAINVMEHLSGDREIVVDEPFNNNYKMYYNRYPKDFFINYLKENNYTIIKTFDNPIYNEESVGDDLTGTNEFSIIARKNN